MSIFDEGSCIIQGTPCDDGNFNTINDEYGEFCNCYGILNTTNCGEDIMISEYVEGSANNKAIELSLNYDRVKKE